MQEQKDLSAKYSKPLHDFFQEHLEGVSKCLKMAIVIPEQEPEKKTMCYKKCLEFYTKTKRKFTGQF